MTFTRRDALTLPLAAAAQAPSSQPWYLRTFRWGQTNLTEKDPDQFDLAFWRSYWKRTHIQGVIVNAGGIVAYYPSKFPLQHRAQFLNDRDLYGEIAKAAHDDGLIVLARMDSNRASEDFYRAHPDWFAVDAAGKPYRAADKYITCINSPYYDEYLPGVITEIIERSRPEGVTDNSWAGLGRDSICYCANCRSKFRAAANLDLPRSVDWNDNAYRQWILWNYRRRTELWEFNNKVTQAAGGPHCIWSGMNSGSLSTQARSFRDLKELCARAHIVMLDHQRRDDDTGFQQNAATGKLLHGLLGWDKLIPESMALYQNARNSFRIAAKPAAESRMWMYAGFAGGIQPWWHHVSAFHEDRRAYNTAEPVLRWWKDNEPYLVNRTPVANVALLWSQRNIDFYGRDNAADLVDLPWRGFSEALVKARIPYLPVHADHLSRDAAPLNVLILPNLGALSDAQCDAIRRFVLAGGSLVATGESSLYNEWGDPRPDFAFADLFLTHAASPNSGTGPRSRTRHTYLRIPAQLPRHEVLQGFEETALLPFGGLLSPMKTDPAATVPLTFVPEFPIYPPETAWMREPSSNIPGLILHQHPGGGRIAFLPAALDRQFAVDHLPDHALLLANLVRWAAAGKLPLSVEGRGLLDCHLYRQPGRLILHALNLVSAGTWRSPIDEFVPAGPFTFRVRLPAGLSPKGVRLLVSGTQPALKVSAGEAVFTVASIEAHEVAVLS